MDSGKPLPIGMFESMMFAEGLNYFAGWCDKTAGQTLPSPGIPN